MEQVIERKGFQSFEWKADQEGSFVAVIATLNVVDKDGDRALPGAAPDGKAILISSYMHSSWGDRLPIGTGTVKEEGGELKVYGQINLKTDAGREHYETIKFTGGLQEWSYGYKVIDSEEVTEDGEKIRNLKKFDIFEASPVLLGAGVDTRTLSIKSAKTTYFDQVEAVLAAVSGLVERTKSLADLRRDDGRDISGANRKKLMAIYTRLNQSAQSVKEFLCANVSENDRAKFILLCRRIKDLTQE
jgi:hypothetical protein